MKRMRIISAIMIMMIVTLFTACGTTHIIVPESSDESESVMYVTPVGDISTTAESATVTEPTTEAVERSASVIEPETAARRFEVTSSRILRAANDIALQ